MERRIRYLVMGVVALAGASASGQQQIEHRSPDFKVTIPDEFTRVEDATVPNAFYVFRKSLDDGRGIGIHIEDLGGTIGLEKLTMADMPPGVENVSLEYWPLSRIEVNVLVSELEAPGGPVAALAAQIPLRQRGVQIVVGGPAEHAEGIRATLRGVLDSFEGELVLATLPDGRVVTVKQLSVGQRLAMLAWSVPSVVGWLALLGYGVFRLCLIGRADRCLKLRRVWLGIAGVGIFLGGAGRGIASMFDGSGNLIYALMTVAVGVLVLNAYQRVGRRIQRVRAGTIGGSFVNESGVSAVAEE